MVRYNFHGQTVGVLNVLSADGNDRLDTHRACCTATLSWPIVIGHLKVLVYADICQARLVVAVPMLALELVMFRTMVVQ